MRVIVQYVRANGRSRTKQFKRVRRVYNSDSYLRVELENDDAHLIPNSRVLYVHCVDRKN